MAEIIELDCGHSITEWESLLLLLFDAEKVQSMVKQRKENEYKMCMATKCKEDCMKFIKYDTYLLKTIELQQKKKGLKKMPNLTNLVISLGRSLNKMFIDTIRCFPKDINMWLDYIKFCKKMNFITSASRVLQQMLEIHGDSKPELFKIAANWELNECNCIEKARKYFLMGIHKHKKSKMLLTEAFKFELIDANRNRKMYIDKNLTMDPTEIKLTSKRAESIYECFIKKLDDVELVNDLSNICAQYDFANELQCRLNNDLYKYESNERMWDILAKRELNSTEEANLKQKIWNCVRVYKTAVTRLNTSRMWEYFINTLLELIKGPELPVFKQKLLINALQQGAKASKLNEKYYLIWLSYLENTKKNKRVLVKVLHKAVNILPKSIKLWHMLLRILLVNGQETEANKVFEQGVAALTTESLPLWKLRLQMEQIKPHGMIEEIFKMSFTLCPEISNQLKPMYLEWLVLNQGIAAARKMYDQMCEMQLPCLEMHKKMMYLESIQPTMNMRRIRLSHTIACAQFGFLDVDVWIDYCKFEINSGDPDKVKKIHQMAQEKLPAEQFESFHLELSLIHSSPLLKSE